MSLGHDDLLVYLDLVQTSADLRAPPPEAPPTPEQPWWSWRAVAEDDVDRGLERWAWGLTAWGREVAVTAALGVLEAVVPLWERAVAAGDPDATTFAENVAKGFDPSPSGLHERLLAWERAPTADAAAALLADEQGSHLDLFDQLGNAELRPYWRDPWMFALTAVYAAALLPGDEEEQLPRLLGNVALSGRRALAQDPEAAAAAFQRMAARLRAGEARR
jgi:hypothetical protein